MIEMKSVDVKSNTYIDSSRETNAKDPKFKVGDIVWISKNKNIFAKDYAPNRPEQFFVIKKLKTLGHGHMLLMILTEKKFLEP